MKVSGGIQRLFCDPTEALKHWVGMVICGNERGRFCSTVSMLF